MSSPDIPDFVAIEGQPTHEEEVAIATAVYSTIQDERVVRSDVTKMDGREEAGSTDHWAEARDQDEAADADRSLEHERTCPVCQTSYDSKFSLEGPRSIQTADTGRSTVCFDDVGPTLFIHRPR